MVRCQRLDLHRQRRLLQPGCLQAYYTFNPSNFLADVSGVTGPLTNIGLVQPAAGSQSSWLGGSQNVADLSQPGGVTDGNPFMQYLAMPAITISSTFTICTWYSPIVLTPWARVCDIGNGVDQSNIIMDHDATAGEMQMVVYPTGITLKKSSGWIANVWQHACLVLYTGTNLTGYYNGIAFSTTYDSAAFSGATYPNGNGWFGRFLRRAASPARCSSGAVLLWRRSPAASRVQLHPDRVRSGGALGFSQGGTAW